MNSAVTPNIVAHWMLGEIQREGSLYQNTAVYDISEKFGENFTYINEGRNLAISRSVLAAFRKISEETVIWERGERMWRKREAYDESGRQQY